MDFVRSVCMNNCKSDVFRFLEMVCFDWVYDFGK